MSRRNLALLAALWLLVLGSALAVVISTQRAREMTIQLSNLTSQQNRLQIAWGQYLLEESSLASYARLEQLATGELALHAPKPLEIRVLEYDE